MASTRTWHPHIYDTPPKRPTPYFVATILGLDSSHMPAFTTTNTSNKPKHTNQIQSNGTESKRVEDAHDSNNDGKKSDSQNMISSDDLGKCIACELLVLI